MWASPSVHLVAEEVTVKIVIAAWHLRDFNVGLGRYCRGLIEGLGRIDSKNRYEILMPDDSHRFPERPNFRYRLIRFPLFKRRLWEQLAPLLAGDYDVLHFPYDSCVAWKRGRFVVTIHDVKPLIFGPAKRMNLHAVIESLVMRDKWGRIDHVVTDSYSSRHDIIAHCGLREDRISVVYPGVDFKRFQPRDSPRIPGVRPYILCVAGADPTKNIETLIEAFARLTPALREQYDLLLAGDFRRRLDLRQLADRLAVEKQTIFAGVVNDGRLIELYQSAAVFVFPSRYEGFGLPVLEAMACGCPVISSNSSSLPEVTGDAALMVNPDDPAAFTHAIAGVLGDPELRQELQRRGVQQAQRFSWDRTAQGTLAVYTSVTAQREGC
jgi:glycosyltransferase involved in cell wall biosynthesis